MPYEGSLYTPSIGERGIVSAITSFLCNGNIDVFGTGIVWGNSVNCNCYSTGRYHKTDATTIVLTSVSTAFEFASDPEWGYADGPYIPSVQFSSITISNSSGVLSYANGQTGSESGYGEGIITYQSYNSPGSWDGNFTDIYKAVRIWSGFGGGRKTYRGMYRGVSKGV